MWWTRRRTDEDFSSEIDAHLALETERLIEDGLTPDAARDAARRKFGNAVAAQERFHEANHWIWLEQLAQDLRYAVRGLWHSRAFTATTVATLAIGLGLVTVVFAVFNAYVLRPFAVRDPYRLHQIVWSAPDAYGGSFRWDDYKELRGRRDLFRDAIAESTRYVSSDNRPILAGFVSGNYFEALGARVLLGRPLASFDAGAPGSSPVAVLTDDGWARLFDRDPGVVGRPLDLNGQRFVIVGVMRPEFSGLDDTPRDLWVPLTMFGEITGQDLFGANQPRELGIVARLADGVTAEQVQAALTPFMANVAERADVRAEARPQATPNPLSFQLVATLSPVFAAFILVLVAACANVSNVMLARANARHREIAMRLSLGASRGRLVRQLLTEGLLIAGLAGLAALALATVTLRTGMTAVLRDLAAVGLGADSRGAARFRSAGISLRAAGRRRRDADVRAGACAPGHAAQPDPRAPRTAQRDDARRDARATPSSPARSRCRWCCWSAPSRWRATASRSARPTSGSPPPA